MKWCRWYSLIYSVCSRLMMTPRGQAGLRTQSVAGVWSRPWMCADLWLWHGEMGLARTVNVILLPKMEMFIHTKHVRIWQLFQRDMYCSLRKTRENLYSSLEGDWLIWNKYTPNYIRRSPPWWWQDAPGLPSTYTLYVQPPGIAFLWKRPRN